MGPFFSFWCKSIRFVNLSPFAVIGRAGNVVLLTLSISIRERPG